jgi:C1A family cysteine protease
VWSTAILCLLGAATCLLLSSSAWAEAMNSTDIQQIQQAIDAKGASWVAGENAITRMTAEERRALLGHVPEPPEAHSRPPREMTELVVPEVFNWGDKDGLNWMTNIKDQGGCGSCWAFATCAAFEARQRIATGRHTLWIDLSEQYLVSCYKGNCDGASATWIMSQIQNAGVCDEACFPYVSGSEYVPPCTDRCSDYSSRMYDILTYGQWYFPTLNATKHEIFLNGPIQVHMDVFEDFYAYAGGVYEYVSGLNEGGHLIVFYGWDNVENCWLAKNSWGTDWGEMGPNGELGWFRIRMGTNEVSTEEYNYFLTPIGLDYPGISATEPQANGPNGAPSDDVAVTFDTDMEPSTIDAASVFAYGAQSGPHPATIGYDAPSRTISIDPVDDFITGEPVCISMTSDVKSTLGLWINTGHCFRWDVTGASDVGAYDEAVDYGTDPGPLGVCTGDLNADGYPDLVSANAAAGNLSVLLSNGDGTFAAAVPYTVGSGPRSVTAADLNADGYLDLAAGNSFSGSLSILINNGDGTFAAATSLPSIGAPRSVISGDFDADGDLDVIASSMDNSALRIHVGNGTGSLVGATNRAVAGSPYSLTAGDLDNDGDFDLVYPDYGASEVHVVWSDGPAVFGSESAYDTETGPRWVTLTDMNGDIFLDLVVANYTAQTVTVMINNGDLSFTSTTVSTSPLKPEAVCSADLNGNGLPDIVASGSNGIRVIANNGDGTYADPVVFTTGAYFEAVAADFDGDADIDIASVSFSGQEVSVLLNNACTDGGAGGSICEGCCMGRVGDANGNGVDEPTIGDVSTLIDAMFISTDFSIIPCLAEADINQSGGIDPQPADVTIGDVSYLIDYLFIAGVSLGLPDCM